MKKLSLAEFGCNARSFAGDREGCSVGRTWRGRAVSGDRVALGTRSCFWGYIVSGMFSDMYPFGYDYYYYTTEEHNYIIRMKKRSAVISNLLVSGKNASSPSV